MAGLDEYTKLLLHNDDVGLTDSSFGGHTTTLNSVSRSGATSKFGGYSARFPGSTYMTVPTHSDWDTGTNNFTFDAWVRFDNLSAGNRLFAVGSQTDGAYNMWFIGMWDSNINTGVYNGAGGYFESSHPVSASINTWYHIAIVREGNNLKKYWNGVYTASQDITGFNLSGGSYGPVLGARWHNGSPIEHLEGYMDEVRFSNGIARWTGTGNFTPPTTAYTVPTKVEGVLSEEAIITLIDETTDNIEYREIVSAGAYEIPCSSGTKTVVAVRESDGDALAYGRVVPVIVV